MSQDISPSVEEILNGLYINPLLAETERYLQSEVDSNGNYLPMRRPFSAEATIKIVSRSFAKIGTRSFARANVTDALALAYLSLNEAQIKYPELFSYT